MQSNNPVFNRAEGFNGRGGGHTMDPSQWAISQPGAGGAPTHERVGERMTIDTVVQKTGMSIGVVVIAALATWILTPEITNTTTQSDLSGLMAAVTIGSLGAFALSLVNSFKKVVSPGLVLAFAVLEGVALGGISKLFNAMFPEGNIVMGAVIGTFAAFAGTLAAYKFFNIQVTPKFRMFVTAAVFGMIGLAVMEMILGAFGSAIGLFGVSGLGMVTAFAGLILGIFMLIMDFDFVERGIAAGLPEKESWRAAFAMTVSLVWIYTNLLRILAFFSQD